LLGVKIGPEKISLKKEKSFVIKTTSLVKIRPIVCGLVAKGGRLDDEGVRQLIALQEDLHFGIGRRRKKASIGIHNLDTVTFPLTYSAVSKSHKFVPLAATQEMTVREILETTDVGRQYGNLVGDTVPVIFDAKGNTISLPPIINSSFTAVSTHTTNLLVEVTGTERTATEDILAVVAATLQNMGFTLFDLSSDSGKTNISKTKTMKLEPSLVNQILGVSLTNSQICSSLRKCRLGAAVSGTKVVCTIPRFRFDILGSMDLIEEIALGYGIEKLLPTIPQSRSVGQKSELTKKLDSLEQIMVGLGFTEVLNSSLTSMQTLYHNSNRDPSGVIEMAESKSQEHTILRDSILPGLLENLSRNIHEQYPQKLFETGVVFSEKLEESNLLACISANKDASFTEIKSTLQAVLKTWTNIECETKTFEHPIFARGKSADILIGGKKVGVIGQIDPQVIENFKIRVPICGFELTLSI
jgi:phenylalanyl-tRNA synthetase beta chain